MKKEYFSIPNCMGYFRILLIPVFLVLYYYADTKETYIAAMAVLFLSCLTDFLDGKIARKFDMVTDFGKMLDPIADKLTQGALAVALTFHYPDMVWVFLLFLAKEIYMGIMGMVLLHKGFEMPSAQWYGKICTGVLDGVIFILFLFPNLPTVFVNVLITFAVIMMVGTLCLYIGYHSRILRGMDKKKQDFAKL